MAGTSGTYDEFTGDPSNYTHVRGTDGTIANSLSTLCERLACLARV